MKYLLTILCLTLSATTFAQTGKSTKQEVNGIDPGVIPSSAAPKPQSQPQVYNYVEVMPVAGYDMNKYIADNIKYPAQARKDSLQGRVIARFVVNENGTLSDIQILRSLSKECDAEVIRIISHMPPWKPGSQNGKPVKVYFTLPVSFILGAQ